MVRRFAVLLVVTLVVTGCTLFRQPAPRIPEREFRGVWVTTVGNSDWPSRPGLSSVDQKRELIAILDCMAATNLNAVVFHTRPNADAFYPSSIEPWSDYLSGELGQAPDYDPLAFAIDESHRRGLEFHAWLNPYRTRHPLSIPSAYPNHISRAHPEYVRQYGRMWWLDPGEPEVRAYIVEVVRDIVRRYDVDAIHFDDYFYPYPEKDTATGQDIDFPDESSWQKYQAGGGTLARNDWRRENVNLLVRDVGAAIKAEKPWVQFGVSPFGIWRPGNPRSVRGLDAYARIYADSKKWLQSGWVDYLTPQLYWGRSAKQQRFDHLLRWWRRQNSLHRHLWPGLGAHRVANGRPNAFPAQEIVDQIERIRAERVNGWILFTAKTLMFDRGGITDRLLEINPTPVPTPATPWIAQKPAASTPIPARTAGQSE